MADQHALRRAFADYARTIAQPYEVGDVLYRLTDQVMEVLDIDGAGVSIAEPEGALRFVTATDEQVATVEEGQDQAQEGPCHDAYRSGDLVTVADLLVEERWDHYRPVAIGNGMRAVAGIPMLAGDRRIGALNLYSAEPREWPADEVEDAQLLADMATGYIINALTLAQSERVAAQLQHALNSRVVIEQAKGMIAERDGIDPSTAFEKLRSHARSNNAKIHDIARAILEGRLRL